MDELPGRILCIDFGEKRIGLAISDPLGITAQPLNLLVRKDKESDFQEILKLVRELDVTRIVIGLPLNMDGSEGFMVKAVREFSKELEKRSQLEIIEMDERLTSLQASRALNQGALKGKEKKQKIDSLSAQIILQTYMNSISN